MNGRLTAVLLAGVLGVSGVALAQKSSDLGKYEYYSKCASCHGISGKGDGSMRTFLTKAPSDLTTLAKRNGGALPSDLVWQVIDGRSIGPHGTRDMPVWGQEFRREIMRTGGPEGPSPEWYVAGRIAALTEHLVSIQAK
jgi:mono/diheme cytochrome c family protein